MSSMMRSAGPPATASARYTLCIEPGHEEMWFALRQLASHFTAAELGQAANVRVGKAEHYLSALSRKGLVADGGKSTDAKQVYVKTRIGATPAVFDDDGEISTEYEIRRILWTATRGLRKALTESMLYDFANEHMSVPRRQVARYIKRMHAAGYLSELFGKSKTGETEYVLRPSMNTGPLPPRFCKTLLVYDLNRALAGRTAEAWFGVGLAQEVQL